VNPHAYATDVRKRLGIHGSPSKQEDGPTPPTQFREDALRAITSEQAVSYDTDPAIGPVPGAGQDLRLVVGEHGDRHGRGAADAGQGQRVEAPVPARQTDVLRHLGEAHGPGDLSAELRRDANSIIGPVPVPGRQFDGGVIEQGVRLTGPGVAGMQQAAVRIVVEFF
jgi:hypothetical protein